MTAVAIATHQRPIPAEPEREILARIERAVQIREAELRYKLRCDEQQHRPLLELLDELERQRLIESALHFRLTEYGRARLPTDYQPPWRYGSAIPSMVRP